MEGGFVKYYYPPRSSQLPAIRGDRVDIFKKIAGLIPEEEGEEFEMTTTQFIIAAALYQVNIYYLIQFIDHLIQYGGLLVFVSFLTVHTLISIPLIILFLFMSSYSKKGFLTFWECAPMFAGLGYSMLLCRLTYAIFQVYFTLIPCLLIINFITQSSSIWENIRTCHFGRLGKCFPMYSTDPINITCNEPFSHRGENQSIFMSTQYYYRFHVIEYLRHTVSPLEIRHFHVWITFFIWTIVCGISMFGVQKVVKVTTNIQLVLNVMGAISVCYGMTIASDVAVPRIIENRFTQLEFWVEMFAISTDAIVLSDMIYMGTLKPKSLTPSQAGLLVGIAKTFFFIMVMFYAQRCTHLVLGHYKFLDTRCLIIFGHDVMFAFVPDVLHRARFGSPLTIIWYLGILISNINVLVYTIIGMVSSIIERFKVLKRYRLFVFTGLCFSGFLGSLHFCTNISMNTIYTYRHYGDVYYSNLALIIINLALMFVYSTKRIMEDYTFTHGVPPKKFYVTAWQTTPIIAMFTFIFMVYQFKESTDETFASLGTMLWSYVHCTIIILPVFGQILAKCLKHVKYRTLRTVTKPSSTWGPGDYLQRHARKYFYPQRDVRYRNNTIVCQHRCILSSENFYEENTKQISKLRMLSKEVMLTQEDCDLILEELF